MYPSISILLSSKKNDGTVGSINISKACCKYDIIRYLPIFPQFLLVVPQAAPIDFPFFTSLIEKHLNRGSDFGLSTLLRSKVGKERREEEGNWALCPASFEPTTSRWVGWRSDCRATITATLHNNHLVTQIMRKRDLQTLAGHQIR